MKTAQIKPSSKETITLRTGGYLTVLTFGSIRIEIEPEIEGNVNISVGDVSVSVTSGTLHSGDYTVVIDGDGKDYITAGDVTITSTDVDWSYPDGHETSHSQSVLELI